MKIIITKKAKKSTNIFICIVIVGIIFINIIGYFLSFNGISVFNDFSLNNKYEVRSRLLTEAVNQVGVNSPEKAANIWASGLKDRSGALQYIVLNNNLKLKYADHLDKSFPNWVTGISSPWVESFEIIETEKINENKYKLKIKFTTLTSAGPAGDYNAVLTIEPEDGFWRISDLTFDKELYSYIGFTPII